MGPPPTVSFLSRRELQRRKEGVQRLQFLWFGQEVRAQHPAWEQGTPAAAQATRWGPVGGVASREKPWSVARACVLVSTRPTAVSSQREVPGRGARWSRREPADPASQHSPAERVRAPADPTPSPTSPLSLRQRAGKHLREISQIRGSVEQTVAETGHSPGDDGTGDGEAGTKGWAPTGAGSRPAPARPQALVAPRGEGQNSTS